MLLSAHSQIGVLLASEHTQALMVVRAHKYSCNPHAHSVFWLSASLHLDVVVCYLCWHSLAGSVSSASGTTVLAQPMSALQHIVGEIAKTLLVLVIAAPYKTLLGPTEPRLAHPGRVPTRHKPMEQRLHLP